MSRTGEIGAEEIKKNIQFEIDEFLGHRDSIDPQNMTIKSSLTLPSRDTENVNIYTDAENQPPNNTTEITDGDRPVKKSQRHKNMKRERAKTSDSMLERVMDFQAVVHEDNKRMKNDFLESMEKQTNTLVAGLEDIASMFNKN